MGRVWPIAGRVLIAAPAAVTLGIATVWFGPKHDIICNQQSALESRLIGDRFGHLDGPTFTKCVTPYAGSYVFAVLVTLAVLVLAGRPARRLSRHSAA